MIPSSSPSLQESAESRVGVVIVSAGEGRRMEGIDKVVTTLSGKPLVAHAVSAFESLPQVSEIVLVLARANVEWGCRLVGQEGWQKVSHVCPGGARRQDSVKAGLQHLSPCQWVVVHDGARPCVTPDIIQRGLEHVRDTGAAVAAVPVKDTIKRVSPEGVVLDTPPRQTLWAVQTPQVFRYDILQRAHRTATEEATDDASLIERMGYTVKVFWGSYENIKVTTPEDMAIAETILRGRGSR